MVSTPLESDRQDVPVERLSRHAHLNLRLLYGGRSAKAPAPVRDEA